MRVVSALVFGIGLSSNNFESNWIGIGVPHLALSLARLVKISQRYIKKASIAMGLMLYKARENRPVAIVVRSAV